MTAQEGLVKRVRLSSVSFSTQQESSRTSVITRRESNAPESRRTSTSNPSQSHIEFSATGSTVEPLEASWQLAGFTGRLNLSVSAVFNYCSCCSFSSRWLTKRQFFRHE